MKFLVGFTVGVAAVLTIWNSPRYTRNIWTRIPPVTPPDWAPRYRRWIDGEEVSWTP